MGFLPRMRMKGAGFGPFGQSGSDKDLIDLIGFGARLPPGSSSNRALVPAGLHIPRPSSSTLNPTRRYCNTDPLDRPALPAHETDPFEEMN